jgi:Ran GTPase-activating protein (RanGAP) involved in mRNA processing and transport
LEISDLFTHVGMKHITDALMTNTSLLSITMYQIPDDSITCNYIGEMFAVNRTLREIHMSYINDLGIEYISRGLAQNQSIIILDLKRSDFTDIGAGSLSVALTRNSTLQKLYLNETPIGSKGAAYIAAALIRNSSIRKLKMADCLIGSEGMRGIAECLKINTTLTYLDLEYNHIHDEQDIISIAIMLNTNTTLRKLLLPSMQTSHAHIYTRALMNNRGIDHLQMRNVMFDRKLANNIIGIIRNNTTIRSIRLYQCENLVTYVSRIANEIRTNTTIISLDLKQNAIDYSRAMELVNMLRQNTTLQRLSLDSNNISSDALVYISFMNFHWSG